jgi:hypothetical protein
MKVNYSAFWLSTDTITYIYIYIYIYIYENISSHMVSAYSGRRTRNLHSSVSPTPGLTCPSYINIQGRWHWQCELKHQMNHVLCKTRKFPSPVTDVRTTVSSSHRGKWRTAQYPHIQDWQTTAIMSHAATDKSWRVWAQWSTVDGIQFVLR